MDNDSSLVRARHLEALAQAAKDYTLAELADITLFGGASYSLPTASETVKGGVKVGTGLSMDGETLNCTLTGGGGTTYSVATTTQAGLMSALDKQHLDAVFQDSTDLSDAVITVVGGNFMPSVNSVSDFNTYKDFNIPYLDNRLKHVMNCDWEIGTVTEDSDFNNNSTDIWLEDWDDNPYLCSDENSVNFGFAKSSVFAYSFSSIPYKVTENTGFVVINREIVKSNYTYDGTSYLVSFKVADTGKVASVSSVSICAAASSVSSAEGYNSWGFMPNMSHSQQAFPILYSTTSQTTSGATTNYNYTRVDFVPQTGSASVTSSVSIGTYYDYEVASKTTLAESPTIDFFCPKFTFNSNTVTISIKGTERQPFLYYSKKTTNANKAITGGGTYVRPCICLVEACVQPIQLTTLSGGVTSTLSPWLEDDDNLICGVWRSRSESQYYGITFKRGTYSTESATWFDNCSTVWTFDFLTPRIFKTNLKLSNILNDLII